MYFHQVEKKKESEKRIDELKIPKEKQKAYSGKPSYSHLDDTLTTICQAAHEKDQEMAYEDYKYFLTSVPAIHFTEVIQTSPLHHGSCHCPLRHFTSFTDMISYLSQAASTQR